MISTRIPTVMLAFARTITTDSTAPAMHVYCVQWPMCLQHRSHGNILHDHTVCSITHHLHSKIHRDVLCDPTAWITTPMSQLATQELTVRSHGVKGLFIRIIMLFSSPLRAAAKKQFAPCESHTRGSPAGTQWTHREQKWWVSLWSGVYPQMPNTRNHTSLKHTRDTGEKVYWGSLSVWHSII